MRNHIKGPPANRWKEQNQRTPAMKLVTVFSGLTLLIGGSLAQGCQSELNGFSLSIARPDETSRPLPLRFLPTNTTMIYTLGFCSSCSAPTVEHWILQSNSLTAFVPDHGSIKNEFVVANKPLSFWEAGEISLPVLYPGYCALFSKGKGLLAANGRTNVFFACENRSPNLAGTAAFDIYYLPNTTDTASNSTRGHCAAINLEVFPK